ncbi:hypothetical protein P7H15_13140 [Paenibacillus larvae]|nr:hypothetical protein [Paenibacillus larvae]MDT2293596.1 hypothetical protein [Paenibacillus larvae]
MRRTHPDLPSWSSRRTGWPGCSRKKVAVLDKLAAYCERSIPMCWSAFWACSRSGGAYVLIEVAYPMERIRTMLSGFRGVHRPDRLGCVCWSDDVPWHRGRHIGRTYRIP